MKLHKFYLNSTELVLKTFSHCHTSVILFYISEINNQDYIAPTFYFPVSMMTQHNVTVYHPLHFLIRAPTVT